MDYTLRSCYTDLDALKTKLSYHTIIVPEELTKVLEPLSLLREKSHANHLHGIAGDQSVGETQLSLQVNLVGEAGLCFCGGLWGLQAHCDKARDEQDKCIESRSSFHILIQKIVIP